MTLIPYRQINFARKCRETSFAGASLGHMSSHAYRWRSAYVRISDVLLPSSASYMGLQWMLQVVAWAQS